jgi:hypothetical protein
MDEISAMASRSAASDHCLVDRISLTPEEAAALLNAPESTGTPLAKRISDLLLARELLVVNLSSLRWSVPQTRQLAHRLAFAIASAMRDAQLPPGLRVEIDVP